MEIRDFLIDENCSMLEAMRQLDEVAKKVLFITKDDHFIATVTDGDIRRWILKHGSLDACVKDIANYQPRFLLQDERHKAQSYMQKHLIEALPIINEDGEIISIDFRNKEQIGVKRMLNIPVIIMAGGQGVRLYPYTKILPKPLIPIGEMPIAEHIINRFIENGCRDFYFVLNYKKNMIKAYFNDMEKDYNLNYIDEDQPLGTGGGLSLLKGKINSTFILSNCDILVEADYKKIYNYHKSKKNLITIVSSLKNFVIPYGVIKIKDNGEVEKLEEKPNVSFLANTGMYIVDSKIIEDLDEKVAIDFPDVIKQYMEAGEKIGIFPISENSWLDMGQFEEMDEMIKHLNIDL
ncbi:sugar phosphate nucleotidyltransferase [Acetobacterium wieringae]|uniref:sugar phosphate nucleotidyltransferase n=1 Tax=Acetobacterium wieringae TaxID=52694 RepID=UPI002B2133C1|nr:sugar phosphate nucleotidyltransferase [Acetobacterium wieringae]MEA4804380.1 sugar phosphate nucleotidyltransferase [Acetobacterium wieringae]